MSEQPTVIVQKSGPGFIVRAIWFVFIGWWASGLALVAAYFCMVTIILLPLGVAIIEGVPKIQTLRPSTVNVTVGENGEVMIGGAEQHPTWMRLLWLPIGIIVGFMATVIAWLVSLTIIGLPASIAIINRLPAVTTLKRN